MSISVHGVTRVSSQPAETHPSGTDTAAVTANAGNPSVSLVEIDQVTHLPVPPRFPWLSRLSAQLEPVAKQKPTFPSTPSLGENLDQAV
jgi:hypothetical protein